MKKKIMLAAALLWGAAAWAINWDEAMINGTTPGGKIFYKPGEEMAFTLKLEGVKEEIPADTYFVDWERRGDDGLTEKGRAPLPFPEEGLVLKTKTDKPGFVCIEANVVTKDGKRVPKNHRWEKRVFFQGGAGVQPELIPMADEPADYDAFWAACLKELAAVPMDAQMTPVECPDKEVRLYAVRIPCAGPWPVTGYLTIPVKASKTNRMPITASYRGASQDEQLPPKNGPHDRISMLIDPNGYELGRGPEYVKQCVYDMPLVQSEKVDQKKILMLQLNDCIAIDGNPDRQKEVAERHHNIVGTLIQQGNNEITVLLGVAKLRIAQSARTRAQIARQQQKYDPCRNDQTIDQKGKFDSDPVGHQTKKKFPCCIDHQHNRHHQDAGFNEPVCFCNRFEQLWNRGHK
jgi:hypothetical protein